MRFSALSVVLLVETCFATETNATSLIDGVDVNAITKEEALLTGEFPELVNMVENLILAAESSSNEFNASDFNTSNVFNATMVEEVILKDLQGSNSTSRSIFTGRNLLRGGAGFLGLTTLALAIAFASENEETKTMLNQFATQVGATQENQDYLFNIIKDIPSYFRWA